MIYNSELLRNNYGKALLRVLRDFSQYFEGAILQNRLNMINSTLSEAGHYYSTKVDGFSAKDLTSSTILYFLHAHLASNSNIKKATEINLLNILLKKRYRKVQVIDQNCLRKINRKFARNAASYYCAPTRTFFETEETYLSSEGVLKRTMKLFLTKNIMTTWQTLLLIVKYLNKNTKPLNLKSYHGLTYNIKGYLGFKIFTHLHSYVTQHLTNINYYLTSRISAMCFYRGARFKKTPAKLKCYKMKFWLEDFFTGGKDEYSKHSAVLASCSNVLRLESKNF